MVYNTKLALLAASIAGDRGMVLAVIARREVRPEVLVSAIRIAERVLAAKEALSFS